jgi:hypothetical protein
MAGKRGRPRKNKVNPQDIVEFTKYPVHFGWIRTWDGRKKSFEFELNHEQYYVKSDLLDKGVLEKYTKIKEKDIMEIVSYGTRISVTNTKSGDEH